MILKFDREKEVEGGRGGRNAKKIVGELTKTIIGPDQFVNVIKISVPKIGSRL